jgi:hypothetical protein
MGLQSTSSEFLLLTGLGHRLKLGHSRGLARSVGQQADVRRVYVAGEAVHVVALGRADRGNWRR